MACGSVSWPGIKPGSWQWKFWVQTSRLPRNSLFLIFWLFTIHLHFLVEVQFPLVPELSSMWEGYGRGPTRGDKANAGCKHATFISVLLTCWESAVKMEGRFVVVGPVLTRSWAWTEHCLIMAAHLCAPCLLQVLPTDSLIPWASNIFLVYPLLLSYFAINCRPSKLI